MKIEFLVSDLEIPRYGIAEKGKQIDVPDNVGEDLIAEGIAKEAKTGNTKEEKESKE
tara:strand:- start:3 stop:173 length:171 start_codon:yes stop_codon:yes gene_type:complete